MLAPPEVIWDARDRKVWNSGAAVSWHKNFPCEDKIEVKFLLEKSFNVSRVTSLIK